MKQVTIVWHRQDLRLEDNPALDCASRTEGLVVPVYIHDNNLLQWSIGAAQKWWLHHSIIRLQKSYESLGIKLVLRQGSAESVILELLDQLQVKVVCWNRCYDPQSIKRDTYLKKVLLDQGVEVKTFNGSLLTEPSSVKNKSGSYFKVFTPYWRECLSRMAVRDILPVPQLKPCELAVVSDDVHEWKLLPQNGLQWADQFSDCWEPGEAGARKKLGVFIENALQNYANDRDIPGVVGTSKLSPHLHFGEISPVEVWYEVCKVAEIKGYSKDIDRYLAELGWREFSYYLLVHFNDLPSKAFNPKFSNFPWVNDESHLRLWQKGMTGYPVVDAGMRELWHTGWMHNRVRMIVASFLTKHLLIPWQLGAEWFLDTLLDADIASNSAGWQWVAGCGADAAPYFRIFNPVIQGQRFDGSGDYVRKWVPELADLPSKIIHEPWKASKEELAKYGVALGVEYPKPIIDHSYARNRALEAYQEIKRD